MFDFAVDSRNEGDTPGRNDKGLVTYDRKTRKDAFFWYKANWTTAPFVYITSRRFNAAHDRDGDREGLLEHGLGAPAGERHDDRDARPAPIASSSGRASRSATGANTVVATGTSGTTTATDTVTWTRN